MYKEITPEREEEVLSRLAQLIVSHRLGTLAILFLQTYKPLAWLGGTYVLMYIAPFLPFFEREGEELTQVLGKIENIEVLITKIETAMTSGEKSTRVRRELGNKNGSTKDSAQCLPGHSQDASIAE